MPNWRKDNLHLFKKLKNSTYIYFLFFFLFFKKKIWTATIFFLTSLWLNADKSFPAFKHTYWKLEVSTSVVCEIGFSLLHKSCHAFQSVILLTEKCSHQYHIQPKLSKVQAWDLSMDIDGPHVERMKTKPIMLRIETSNRCSIGQNWPTPPLLVSWWGIWF